MRPLITFILLLLFYFPSGHAWGVVGHETVAAIAETYLTPEARAYVAKNLLENETIISVATWADSYRASPKGKFSRPYQ